jgi:hypothetical protein
VQKSNDVVFDIKISMSKDNLFAIKIKSKKGVGLVWNWVHGVVVISGSEEPSW